MYWEPLLLIARQHARLWKTTPKNLVVFSCYLLDLTFSPATVTLAISTGSFGLNLAVTHVFIMVEGVKDVVRQTGQQVDDKPGLHVIETDHLQQQRMFCMIYTERRSSAAPFARQPHHPISSASFNLKGCNLVCATGWSRSALTKNFSPIGPVVPEIWSNMWEK